VMTAALVMMVVMMEVTIEVMVEVMEILIPLILIETLRLKKEEPIHSLFQQVLLVWFLSPEWPWLVI